MGPAEGDVVHVASESGAVDKPLSVKEGPQTRRARISRLQGPAGGVRLMGTPAKWVEVKVQQRVK